MADTNQLLEQILGAITGDTGGFKSSVNRTMSYSMNEIEDKIKKFLTKSEKNVRNIISQKMQSSNNRNYATAIGEIEGNTKVIKEKATNIATGVDTLNNNISTLTNLLQSIQGHIGQNVSQNSPTNSSNNTSSNTTIETTVKDILAELKGIHTSLNLKNYDQNDKSLLEKLNKLQHLKIDAETRQAEHQKFLNEGDIPEWFKRFKGNGVTKEEYVKDYKERERRRKEREKEIERSGSFKERSKDYFDEKLGYTKKEKFASIAKGGFGLLADFSKEKPDTSKAIDKGISVTSDFLTKAGGPWGAVAGAFMQAVKALFDLGAKQDKATTEFARAVGGFSRGKYTVGESVRSMIGTADIKRGYTADAAYSAMTEIAEARGRTTERLSPDALKSAIDLKRFGIGADAINNFDTFGKSLEDTDRYFAKLYSEVSKKGLSFKNVSKAVNDNLKAAQSHTFANGLRGLEQMAEKSVQLKYNMQQVFQFADKVSEVEGAISTAANLSVLGGTFAQYSNPMQMLYEGLNDMEALQSRIEKTFGEKAFWNQEKGQMDMTAYDREIVKQAAKSMGLDPNEMLSLSYNQGKMKRVEGQIGKGLGKDTTEYIKNIAELDKNGKAYVSLNGKEVAVSQLTEKDKSALEKESKEKNKADNAKLGDIYQNTMSITEKMDNILVYLQEKLGRWVFGIFQALPWAKDRRAEAQGTGSREEMEMRGKLFDAYSGTDPKKYARYLAKKSESDLRDLMAEKGIAANGIIPNFSMPGDSGFINGKSHLEGGVDVMYGNKPYNFEGKEHVTPKLQSIMYNKELTQIKNGTFNPYSYANDLIKNDMNKYFNQMKVAPSQNKPNVQNEPVSSNAVNGRIKIDIPETITINLAGGEKIGDYDVREIVMAYVDKFMKEATMRKNFSGFNKEEFYNKSDVI